MSVVSVKEIHDGREGGDSVSQNSSEADITRKFRVITDAATDDAETVLAACAVLGATHPTVSGMFIKSRRAVNEPFSKLVWIVTLKYALKYEMHENPLSQPAEITWQTETSQENATADKDDEAILNSAGDYYEDGVPTEKLH